METVDHHNIGDRRRTLLFRIVFIFILLWLVYAAISNTLFHQLQAPVLRYPYVDPVYWVMHLLRIPDAAVSNYTVAYIADALLFITCIGAIVFPKKRIFILLFLPIYFVYFIVYNSYGGHHTHAGVGILLIPIPFLFSKKITFSLLWEGLRYYTLFVYASSFLWKLFRFSFLQPDQGLRIMKNNLTPYIYYNPGSVLSGIYHWLIVHPLWANVLYILGFVAEGLFIVGFFTKKFDRHLVLLSVILITGFWFLADALFFQLLILSFTLVNFDKKRSESYI